ncbi:Similar to Ubiquitin carboxyl-terminal hydrolase 16; acc. no. P0CAQ1 [Pyronema omphalodes CBS 100304]|uniref:Ubiquitin carboxyl-terminal hydrolase n=1 Tax=Pyronema omphalodes (strain CBS 100304) TaxID=1076935 RepID=U4LG52_PYROM|nr:Similar to Ubiquitin carboxyl-terminal hydrolase 16; acc. no. P0CAQ1 [Pyronema omphalodes CBS 100304]
MAPAEKHVTLAYAATASLAAVTLVYVFAPTWFIDSTSSSSKDRKRCVVGLVNPANDCFINSILQALAGLEDLRSYLSQRTQAVKLRSEYIVDFEQKPFLTIALKEILDSLNERPLQKKTISARPFLLTLERVFKKQISRTQQDAHEFLQVVAETLAEEHEAMMKLEKELVGVKRKGIEELLEDEASEMVIVSPPEIETPREAAGASSTSPLAADLPATSAPSETTPEEKPAAVEPKPTPPMPLIGHLISTLSCQTCSFSPKPTTSSFVVLTLPVPQKSSTTLADCIDLSLSLEFIDDFHCSGCHLSAAISHYSRRLASLPPDTPSSVRSELETTIAALREADPENPPPNIPLPPASSVPKTRISKQTSITHHPAIIALHLSRSIFDTYPPRKNTAKVQFKETLQMGGILRPIRYRLMGVVVHKGGHDSGHYECFRRQVTARGPYSTPSPAGMGTPIPGMPMMGGMWMPGMPRMSGTNTPIGTPIPGTPGTRSSAATPGNSTPGSPYLGASGSVTPVGTSIRLGDDLNLNNTRPSMSSDNNSFLSPIPTPVSGSGRTSVAGSIFTSNSGVETEDERDKDGKDKDKDAKKRKKKEEKEKEKRNRNNKWWRISDDKIKECRTSDVLGMQKEVYLLFYQREERD